MMLLFFEFSRRGVIFLFDTLQIQKCTKVDVLWVHVSKEDIIEQSFYYLDKQILIGFEYYLNTTNYIQ